MNFYQKILPSLRYHDALSSDINIITNIYSSTNLSNDCVLVDTINFYDISELERSESNLYRFNGKINFFYNLNLLYFNCGKCWVKKEPPTKNDIDFITHSSSLNDGNVISGYKYNLNWIMQLTYPSSILRNKPWKENPNYCYENGLLIEKIELTTINSTRKLLVCTCADHKLEQGDYAYINNNTFRGTYRVENLGDGRGKNFNNCFISSRYNKVTNQSNANVEEFEGTLKRMVDVSNSNFNSYFYEDNIEFVFNINYNTFTGNTCVGQYCGIKYYPDWQYSDGQYYTNPRTPKWWAKWDDDRNFIAFCVPEGHGLLRGDYVEIITPSNCLKMNGLHRVKYLGIPYTFNDGNCSLSGKDYFFNDKVFVIDLDVDLDSCPLNPDDLVWRKVEGCASEYMLREFEIISDENDYEIFKNGYEWTIYGQDNQQFQFNRAFDLEGKTDYLGRPLTELHMAFIKTPGRLPYHWTHIMDELDFRICGKDNRKPIYGYKVHNDPFPGLSDYLDYPFNYLGDGINFGVVALWTNYSNKKFKDIGSKYIGDLIEYNVCDLSERVISHVKHRFNSAEREGIFKHCLDIDDPNYYDTNGEVDIDDWRIAHCFACETDGDIDALEEHLPNVLGNDFCLFKSGFAYRPFHRIEIKSLSDYIEYGDSSADIKQDIPAWAECYANNYRWRDVLDQGTYKLEGRYADYPFINGCHYIYKNFNLCLERQCKPTGGNSDGETYCCPYTYITTANPLIACNTDILVVGFGGAPPPSVENVTLGNLPLLPDYLTPLQLVSINIIECPSTVNDPQVNFCMEINIGNWREACGAGELVNKTFDILIEGVVVATIQINPPPVGNLLRIEATLNGEACVGGCYGSSDDCNICNPLSRSASCIRNYDEYVSTDSANDILNLFMNGC